MNSQGINKRQRNVFLFNFHVQQWQNCEMDSGGSLYYKIKDVNILCLRFTKTKYLIFALIFLKAVGLGGGSVGCGLSVPILVTDVILHRDRSSRC